MRGNRRFSLPYPRRAQKIADYPFTTLYPHLGVARIDSRTIVIADIPGLVEGAHEGVGIGDRFLGHVERTGVLLHLVSAQEHDVAQAYKTVREEIVAYGAGLADKPEVLALSQIDTADDEAIAMTRDALAEAAEGATVHLVSSVTHKGLETTLRALQKAIDDAKPEDEGPADPRWNTTTLAKVPEGQVLPGEES